MHVVIVGYSLTSLGVARCLARSSCKVVAIGTRSRAYESPLLYSNIPARKVLLERGEDIVGALIALGEDLRAGGQRIPLMITCDRDLDAISRARDRLVPYYAIDLPPDDTVQQLLDRSRFARLAGELGLRIPRTVRVEGPGDLANAAASIGYPLAAKPHLLRSREIRDATELRDFTAHLAPIHWQGFVLQQWIRGSDDHLFACLAYLDRSSTPLGVVTLQKLRQWRPGSGSATLCRTVSNRVVRESALQLLRGLGVTGYGSVEYKYNASDGRYYVMEPTVGRFNQPVGITQAAGVNLPEIARRYSLGLSVGSRTQDNGVWWIDERGDLFSHWHPDQPVRDGYWRRLMTARAHGLFAARDPLPLLAAIGATAVDGARRGLDASAPLPALRGVRR